jgi:N-acetylmuramoyl-L-alanine amidase
MTLRAEFDGAPPTAHEITVESGKVADAGLVLSGIEEAAAEPVHFSILDPDDWPSTTTRATVHILGKSLEGRSATIAGVEVPVLSTGIFVRDNVPLSMGRNEIVIEVRNQEGETAERTVEIVRVEQPAKRLPETDRLMIDGKSIRPARDVILAPGEELEVGFEGTPGQIAHFRLPTGKWVEMSEMKDADSDAPTGRYRGAAAIRVGYDIDPNPLRVRLRATRGSRVRGRRSVIANAEGKVGVWGSEKVRLAVAKDDGTPLAFGLHEVRLGGPYLAEVTSGTILRIVGQRGSNYHVRLSGDTDAWVSMNAVEWAPAGTEIPHLMFTNLSSIGNEDDDYDQVIIPYHSAAPFAITPVTGTEGRAAINVDFYGAHNAATWVSHRPTARQVREMTVEQIGIDHVRVHIDLFNHQQWGYRYEVRPGSLRILIRRPPQIVGPPESPLTGLTVALEPGHGGINLGAVGVSGVPEKEINRMMVEELAEELVAAGAEVVIVRKADEPPLLSTRARRIVESNADLFISIHANAAGQSRGYLRVSGTSTYYKYPLCRDFSEAIHARLLERTGLGDFGNVGAFNYYPLRTVTWMPTMLVEQAFMSNPEDEAKMLDPEFRKTMAIAIRQGTEDFLRQAAE